MKAYISSAFSTFFSSLKQFTQNQKSRIFSEAPVLSVPKLVRLDSICKKVIKVVFKIFSTNISYQQIVMSLSSCCPNSEVNKC